MDLFKEVKDKSFYYKDSWGDEHFLLPVKRNYCNNNRIAIELYDIDRLETYGYLTTNIDIYIHNPSTCAFIDINNFSEGIDLIKNNKLGEFTGIMGRSGYCTYPLFKFNLEKLFDGVELSDYEIEKKERLDNLEDLFYQEDSDITPDEMKELLRSERVSKDDLTSFERSVFEIDEME